MPVCACSCASTTRSTLHPPPTPTPTPDTNAETQLEGDISDQLQGRFSPGLSLPALTEALEKAARDPRIVGLAVEIKPLAVRRVCV